MDKTPQKSKHNLVLLKAMLIAVLVHGLLLVLFQQAPTQESSNVKDLPTVSRIDLSDPVNRQFADWLASHDPSRMVMPDQEIGFSKFAAAPARRIPPEDLPRLPELSLPRTPQPQPITGKLRGNVSSMPQHIPVWHTDTTDPRYGFIQFNNRLLIDAEKYLQLFPLPEIQVEKLPPTVVKIGAARISGIEPRVELRKSCGNEQIDMIALKIARKYLAQNEKIRPQGEMTFIWRSKINKSGDKKP